MLLSKLAHPNIVLYMGACIFEDKIAIVSELCEMGNLVMFLACPRQKKLGLYERLQIVKQVTMGVGWLHGSDPQIIHRDIKSANILLNKHGVAKICGKL